MAGLVERLRRCEARYVRCIKSNDARAPLQLDAARAREQVRHMAVLENVRVRKAGFAFRERYGAFLARYGMLCGATWPRARCADGAESERAGVAAVLRAVNCDHDGFTLGRGKVFVRKPMTLFALEAARGPAVARLVRKIQRCWRDHRARERRVALRRRAAVLLGGAKRRGASFRLYFCGDYCGAHANPALRVLLLPGEQVLFADTVTKFSRDNAPATRTLLITDRALLLLRPHAPAQAPRRVPLELVTALALSTYADGFLAVEIEGGRQPGWFLHTPRKTEIVVLCRDARPQLGLVFRDTFHVVARKPGLMARGALERHAVAFAEAPNEPPSARPRVHLERARHNVSRTIQLPPNLYAAGAHAA
jgi:hypothetical protein